MFKNKKMLPQEGDLLFQRKSIMQKQGFWLIFLFLISGLLVIPDLVKNGYQSLDFSQYLLVVVLFSSSIGILVLLFDGFKNGFSDETYEGYFFPDRIVFYRISNYVKESYIQKKTKEEVLREIIQIKDEIKSYEMEVLQGADLNPSKRYPLQRRLSELEHGLEIIENPEQKFKSELYFKDVEYFMSQKKEIKVVKDSRIDELKQIYFFNQLELTSKYKKSQAEVVEFLNKKVTEAKNME